MGKTDLDKSKKHSEKAARFNMKFEKVLPNLKETEVRQTDVRKGYFELGIGQNIAVSLAVVAILSVLLHSAVSVSVADVSDLVATFRRDLDLGVVLVSGVCLFCVVLVLYFMRSVPVYLVDFSLYQGPEELQCPKQKFVDVSRGTGFFNEKSMQFQEKILARSAIDERTCFPPGFYENPPIRDMKAAREEAEMVLFPIVQDLLDRTGTKAKDIDILVVNCSLFCPTPSLSAMIVNHFKMQSKVKSFNLGGMGCSAGVISIDLAKDLLKVHKNSLAMVISTENITQNWYTGNERSMLLSNTLFRVGGAAMLLSNRSQDKARAKLKLVHTVRTHKGADDECYNSVFQMEDPDGITGVRLSRSIMEIAGEALKSNITTLGPLSLPWSEQIQFFVNMIARKVLRGKLPKSVPPVVQNVVSALADVFLWLPKPEQKSFLASIARSCRSACNLPLEVPEDTGDIEKAKIGAPYVPDFTKAFEHFCVHAGGRAVIDAIEVNLSLDKQLLEASRATLARYGNTSSSSIWYEMDYHMKHSKMKKGDRIWQIAFGSGFKCNSAVWESLQN